MNKNCEICQEQGKYKCPTCLIYYCSVTCCKIHRENVCALARNTEVSRNECTEVIQNPEEDDSPVKKRKIDSSMSTLDIEKLESLKTDEELNQLLANKHLRNLLTTIDESENVEEIMQKAMQEPLLVEFADACLRVVTPDVEDD